MAIDGAKTQGVEQPNLTIGELARRTGLTTGLLRMWETRHGFPRPHRLESGHRRYAESEVERIESVLRRRDAGIRLESAIAEVASYAAPSRSVFAELRRRHPHLVPHRLRKSTLLPLSWALEDECCARAQRAVIFGAFQEERYYEPARPRWQEIARGARSTMVMAGGATPGGSTDRPLVVPLDADAPMRREWAVVCDAPDLPTALTGWELPGQGTVPDRDRVFETVWTIDARAVRDAARVCAQVAHDAGIADATRLLPELSADPPSAVTDLVGATALFNRVLAYADRLRG